MARTRHPHDRHDVDPARDATPHPDPAILHAPGSCDACDEFPDWQAHCERVGIAFTSRYVD